MCNIIHKPKGVTIPEADIRAVAAANTHGFGLMYYNPDLDKIVTRKGIKITLDEQLELIESLKDYEACFHWRIRTDGDIVDKLCHPFKVLDTERHGSSMFMMHNGVISKTKPDYKNERGDSDTSKFVRETLRPMLRLSPKLVTEPKFKEIMEDYIGHGSRLVFMYGKGKVFKYHADRGSERNGCWFSNLNGITSLNFYGGTGGYSGVNNQKKPSTPSQTTGTTSQGTPPSTTTPNTVFGQDTTGNFAKRSLAGQYVRIGDEVNVYSLTDTKFHEIGKVTEFGKTTVKVDTRILLKDAQRILTDEANPEDALLGVWFNLQTGLVECNNLNGYQAIPGEITHTDCMYENKRVNVPATISGNVVSMIQTAYDKNDAEQKAQEEKKSLDSKSIVDQTQGTSTEADTETDAEDTARTKTPAVNPKAQGDTGPTTSDGNITFNGITIDPEECWGANSMTDSDMDYNGTTILEFHQMTDFEKLRYMVNNPQYSFSMMKDLADFYVTQEDYLLSEEESATSTRSPELKYNDSVEDLKKAITTIN